MKERTKLIVSWGAAIAIATSGITGCVTVRDHIEGGRSCYELATTFARDIDMGPVIQRMGNDKFLSMNECDFLEGQIQSLGQRREEAEIKRKFVESVK